jgi:hypothetical protein
MTEHCCLDISYGHTQALRVVPEQLPTGATIKQQPAGSAVAVSAFIRSTHLSQDNIPTYKVWRSSRL